MPNIKNLNAIRESIIGGKVAVGLAKRKAHEKVCNSHLRRFQKFVHDEKSGLNKQVIAYFEKYGYPQGFLHTTNYVACEDCRKQARERSKKRRNNDDACRRYLNQLQKIHSDIDAGTFKRHGGNDLEILWRKKAAQYALRMGLAKDTPFIDKMKEYKKAREHTDTAHHFYSSQEWKSLRFLILKAYGPKCMQCNTEFEDTSDLHCDHILPRSLFPQYETDPNNMQILCQSCNSSKSNRNHIDYRPIDWREKLAAVL